MLSFESKKPNPFSKKNLILVSSINEFEYIVSEPEQCTSVINKIEEEQQNKEQLNRQEIYVPRHGLLNLDRSKHLKSTHPSSIQSHGYFRLRHQHNLPDPSRYELTISDIQFIKILKQSYNFNTKYKFKTMTFIDIIQSCEHNFHKHKTINITENSTTILKFLSFKLPSSLIQTFTISQKKQLNSLILQVIDYWKKQKNQRQGFPFLRIYWPKTDIAMSKYRFWVPFKTRVIEQIQKKPSITLTKSQGNIELEIKISKKVKQATQFFNQVKELANIQSNQHSRFKKETIKFHKYAALYGFESPQNLLTIFSSSQNKVTNKVINKFENLPYFNSPFIKINTKSKSSYHLNLYKLFSASFNPKNNIFELNQEDLTVKCSENSFYSKASKKGTSFENLVSQETHKRSKELHSCQFGEMKQKGSKKVKIN